MIENGGPTIAENLREMMRQKKLKITDVAERSGIPYRTLQNYLYGRTEFPITAYVAVCKAASIPFEMPIQGRVKLEEGPLAIALKRTLGAMLPRITTDGQELIVHSPPNNDANSQFLTASVLAKLITAHYQNAVEAQLKNSEE